MEENVGKAAEEHTVLVGQAGEDVQERERMLERQQRNTQCWSGGLQCHSLCGRADLQL